MILLVFFLALSAALAVPFLEFRVLTARAGLSPAEAATFSLPWRYLIGALLLDFGGFHEWMTYLGVVPLALAVCAVALRRWSARTAEVVFWLGAAAVAAVFSLGDNTPLFPPLVRLVPILGWLRVPPRTWFIAGVAVAVLAALGARALADAASARAARRFRLAAVGWGALVWGLALGAWAVGGKLVPELLFLAVASSAGLALVVLRTSNRLPSQIFVAISTVAVAAELVFVGSILARTRTETEAFSPGRNVAYAVHKRLQAAGDVSARVYSPSYSLPQHAAAEAGLQLADGVNPLQLDATVDFMGLATGVPAQGYSVTLPRFATGSLTSDNANAVPNPRLLNLLNVRVVASEFSLDVPGLRLTDSIGMTRLYDNTESMPYAYVATRIEAAADRKAALDMAARGITAVESGPPIDGSLGIVPAQLVSKGLNYSIISTNADQPGLLVVSEVEYPGWQATLDNVPAPIARAAGLLRAVYVPAGAHTVEFRFVPGSVYVGASITGLGLLALAVAHNWPMRLLRRRERQ